MPWLTLLGDSYPQVYTLIEIHPLKLAHFQKIMSSVGKKFMPYNEKEQDTKCNLQYTSSFVTKTHGSKC